MTERKREAKLSDLRVTYVRNTIRIDLDRNRSHREGGSLGRRRSAFHGTPGTSMAMSERVTELGRG